jgi:hypothetical protein
MRGIGRHEEAGARDSREAGCWKTVGEAQDGGTLELAGHATSEIPQRWAVVRKVTTRTVRIIWREGVWRGGVGTIGAEACEVRRGEGWWWRWREVFAVAFAATTTTDGSASSAGATFATNSGVAEITTIATIATNPGVAEITTIANNAIFAIIPNISTIPNIPNLATITAISNFPTLTALTAYAINFVVATTRPNPSGTLTARGRPARYQADHQRHTTHQRCHWSLRYTFVFSSPSSLYTADLSALADSPPGSSRRKWESPPPSRSPPPIEVPTKFEGVWDVAVQKRVEKAAGTADTGEVVLIKKEKKSSKTDVGEFAARAAFPDRWSFVRRIA